MLSTTLLVLLATGSPSSPSTSSSSSSPSVKVDQSSPMTTKPRILCLHGKFQSGSIFSNKIAGARRKLAREYDLHFLDGPILLPLNNEESTACNGGGDDTEIEVPRGWWVRSPEGKHTLVKEAFEYVFEQTSKQTSTSSHHPSSTTASNNNHHYDAILGFSQGGTLATALVLSGQYPNVKAVVTAGAPYVEEAFKVAESVYHENSITGNDNNNEEHGELSLSKENPWLQIPKLHLAGEYDALVDVESTRKLCEEGGNGQFIVHDQGHLFPTRSARVKEILDFLQSALSETNDN